MKSKSARITQRGEPEAYSGLDARSTGSGYSQVNHSCNFAERIVMSCSSHTGPMPGCEVDDLGVGNRLALLIDAFALNRPALKLCGQESRQDRAEENRYGVGPRPDLQQFCWLTSERHPGTSSTENLLDWRNFQKEFWMAIRKYFAA